MASQARPRVLVIDDEPEIRELLKTVLEEKYDVLLGADGSEGIRLARENKPDLIVLDILMPVMDGIGACETLRTQDATRGIPVIMLTALKDSAQKIKAFKAGADDYLAKPFYPEELMARIDSKLRRLSEGRQVVSTDTPPPSTRPKQMICGNLVLDNESMEVRIDNREVVLTMLEFNLLKYFIENKGKLRSREQILESVWNSTTISGRILDPHILALRKKTEGFDHALSTVYGGGYILKAIPK